MTSISSPMVRRAAACALLLAACGRGGSTAAVPAPTPVAVADQVTAAQPPVDEPAPKLRLPGGVVPRALGLELTLDPAKEEFSGVARIDVNVAAPHKTIWLDAIDLKVVRATVISGDKAIAASAEMAPPDFVGLHLAEAVPAGPATIEIVYEGKLPSDSNDGIYRVEDRGAWGIYTQFEAIDSRRAFPGFDEPAFKVPVTVALVVPEKLMAVANTPVVSETVLEGGSKRVAFAPTRPLPTYLVAFAVGDFEAVEVGKVGRAQTPTRVIVPRGHADEVGYVRDTTPRLVELCEAWFDSAHPYPKLDLIAVPRKGGAMENPGLITFGLPILAIPADELTIARKRRFVTVAIHELAHQWFGDLVTTAWWDDLWLNEAFATYVERKLTAIAEPTWGVDVDIVEGKARVMDSDALATARRIREPIVTRDDIEDAFDGITYTKGRAVLAMVEAYVGEAKFQQGVRAYVTAHADGNATTAQFVAAISHAAGKDVAPVFASFTDQVGVPLVDATLSCEGAPTVALTQRRYRPAGAGGPDDGVTWKLPLCVTYDRGDAPVGRACTLLDQPTGTITLTDATACPPWIIPNAGMASYARVGLEPALLDKALAAPSTTLAEKVGLVLDLGARARAGVVPLADALAPVATLAGSPERHFVTAALGLAGLVSEEYTPDALRPTRAKWLRDLFSARARKLGMIDKPTDSDEDRMLRPAIVTTVADAGQDPVLRDQAKALAQKWLKKPDSLPPGRVGAVLAFAAAHRGDRALFEALLAKAKAEKDRSKRQPIMGALGSFQDPKIVARALALTLTDELVARESITFLWGALDERATREQGWVFLEQNLDKLVARLPRDYGANLIDAGGSFCDPEHRARAVALFEKRAATWTGGPRAYAQMLEGVDLCIAQRAIREPQIQAFLTAR